MAGEAAKPQQPPAYRLVAADELGVLKVVEVPAGPKWEAAAVVSQWGTADKSNAVHSLACSGATSDAGTHPLLAVGRRGGRVDILDVVTGEQQGSLTAAAAAAAKTTAPASKTTIVALHFIPATQDRPLQFVLGASDGTVSVCSLNSNSSDSQQLSPSSSRSWQVSSSFSVGSNLSCMAVDSAGTHIVVGSEGSQPSLWQLSSGSRVWQAKGGKPNRVGLVDKPHTTAVAFLPSTTHNPNQESAGAEGAGSGVEGGAISRRFIAGSVAAKLQLYDTAAGRRPQQEAVFGESRITALAVEPSGQRVWAANGTGHMQLLVLSSNKLLDALKGAGGSVRALALNPNTEPLIASVGLDRFLRVHDTSSKAGRIRVYLKQQLTSVTWLPVQQTPTTAAAEAAPAVTAAAATVADAGLDAVQRKASKPKSRGRGSEKAEATAASVQHSKKQRKQVA